MYRFSNTLIRGAVAVGLALSSRYYNSDLYVVDGGSGKTRALVNYKGADWLDQANTTLQCALPAAVAGFANKLCLAFTGTELYQSTLAAVDWDAAHAGNVEIWSVIAPTTDTSFRFLWSTTTTSNVRGANIFLRNSFSTPEIGKSGANVIPGDATSRIALPAAGTPLWIRCGHSSAATPDFYHQRSGGAAVTRDYANAPDALGTAPTYSLALGAAAGNLSFIGPWRNMSYGLSLDASGVDVMKQSILQDTGIV